MNELKKARLKARKYKKLYDAELKKRKSAEGDALFATSMCLEAREQCEELKTELNIVNSVLKAKSSTLSDVIFEKAYLSESNESLSASLERANRLYIDTYNTMQEIDAKRAELVRENNLLHDTLRSYKIPLHRKTWAEVKHGFKSWVKQFDEK